MRNYIKKKESEVSVLNLSADELINSMFSQKKSFKSRVLKLIAALLIILPVAYAVIPKQDSLDEISGVQDIALVSAPVAATSAKKDVISVPTGTVKANPFLPYRNIERSSGTSDVPDFELIEPPEAVSEGSDAARVMDTIVSGILYDKYSPSAILNIEGNDYLVKKGDVINNYKVMNIMQDSVTVKLGANVYKAGIGEILTEGEITHNDVSNLSKKFGGERR